MGIIERLEAFGRMRERVKIARERAHEVLGVEKGEEFLETGNIYLGGKAPMLAVMDNDEGYLKVMGILDLVVKACGELEEREE